MSFQKRSTQVQAKGAKPAKTSSDVAKALVVPSDPIAKLGYDMYFSLFSVVPLPSGAEISGMKATTSEIAVSKYFHHYWLPNHRHIIGAFKKISEIITTFKGTPETFSEWLWNKIATDPKLSGCDRVLSADFALSICTFPTKDNLDTVLYVDAKDKGSDHVDITVSDLLAIPLAFSKLCKRMPSASSDAKMKNFPPYNVFNIDRLFEDGEFVDGDVNFVPAIAPIIATFQEIFRDLFPIEDANDFIKIEKKEYIENLVSTGLSKIGTEMKVPIFGSALKTEKVVVYSQEEVKEFVESKMFNYAFDNFSSIEQYNQLVQSVDLSIGAKFKHIELIVVKAMVEFAISRMIPFGNIFKTTSFTNVRIDTIISQALDKIGTAIPTFDFSDENQFAYFSASTSIFFKDLETRGFSFFRVKKNVEKYVIGTVMQKNLASLDNTTKSILNDSIKNAVDHEQRICDISTFMKVRFSSDNKATVNPSTVKYPQMYSNDASFAYLPIEGYRKFSVQTYFYKAYTNVFAKNLFDALIVLLEEMSILHFGRWEKEYSEHLINSTRKICSDVFGDARYIKELAQIAMDETIAESNNVDEAVKQTVRFGRAKIFIGLFL